MTADLRRPTRERYPFRIGRSNGRCARLLEENWHDGGLAIARASARVIRCGSRASFALADLYGRDCLRCDLAVEPWPHSPDARFGPHVSFVADRRALCRGVAALSLAHDQIGRAS